MPNIYPNLLYKFIARPHSGAETHSGQSVFTLRGLNEPWPSQWLVIAEDQSEFLAYEDELVEEQKALPGHTLGDNLHNDPDGWYAFHSMPMVDWPEILDSVMPYSYVVYPKVEDRSHG